MGCSHEFRCSSCGYRTEVSGGDDVGMQCRTTTILCEKCHTVIDVVVSDEPWEGEEKVREPKCPKSGQHPVRRWTAPGPCPRCGEQLERGNEVCMWD